MNDNSISDGKRTCCNHLNRDTITSGRLFKGRKLVKITHEGETYRLQLTSNNRLILTK
ncbi:MAG: hemin uptake protein HemP [Rhodospirillales bacterium]|nr:hemin uptake protein HemP [Rhodospirillales bacterium]MBO6785710.1 hemin uptake protein HemP [Rhodospirillales bacterium]